MNQQPTPRAPLHWSPKRISSRPTSKESARSSGMGGAPMATSLLRSSPTLDMNGAPPAPWRLLTVQLI